MDDAEVVAREPRSYRRAALVAVVVLALVAGAAAVRYVLARGAEREPRTGRYVTLDGSITTYPGEAADTTYLFAVRSAWPEPVTVVSVVPLAAGGAEVPYLSATMLDAGIPGRSQLYGVAPPPERPGLIEAGAEATLALRVPAGCTAPVVIEALRFRFTTGQGPAEQVVLLTETHPAHGFESGTGCPSAAPGP